ncbi:MAG: hypothetical protein AAF065_01895 [Verrucomicrobiota bacterium]
MNTLKNTTLIATLALTLAGSAFAGANPQEQNRQITRGNGAADAKATQFTTVYGQKATAHTINRHSRTASQREALRNEVNSAMATSVSEDINRVVTPFKNNRNS